MKHISRMLGVTLLEIMLVLAIAAMIIVMSIRYYQSASMGQKVNTAINTITGIVAAGENYLNANGSYTGMTTSSLSAFLPGGASTYSPWGGQISITGSTSTYSFNMDNVPTQACTQMKGLLKANKKVDLGTACTTVTIHAY